MRAGWAGCNRRSAEGIGRKISPSIHLSLKEVFISADKKWKRFEDLAAHIQRTIAPGATVQQNLHIQGKRSHTPRQIDIAVTSKVGQYDLFIAIDCKDYKRAVNVKDVEEFMGLIEDVGANKGAIVAAHGFSEAAKTRATDAGIDLYRLVDAEAHDWQSYVTIPVLVEDCSLSAFSLTISGTGPVVIRPQNFRTMVLFRLDGSPIDNVNNLIASKWNKDELPRKPGEHPDLLLTNDETYVQTDGVLYKVNVRANIIVTLRLFFGQVPLVEIKGFSDEVRGGVITKSFTTAPINFAEIEQTWQKIESPDTLAVKPIMTLHVSSYSPLIAIQE